MLNLHFVLCLLFCSIIFTLNAQQVCKASPGTITHSTPLLGFNTNGHIPPNVPINGNSGSNWTQQWFRDSTIALNPEILRFPGGTNANHWDWKAGWFRPGYLPPTSPLAIKFDDFKPAVLGSNGKAVFVLNIETSNVRYEMDGLRYADSIGLNPSLFEIGNEHNLPSTVHPLQEMASTDYAQIAKTYYDSIKMLFPNGKVCVVAGNTPKHATWHADVLAQIPTIEAFAFHVYLTANNADLNFNVNRALAIPFGSNTNSATLPFRFNTGGFNSLPPDKEVWVTEYNLEETQVASKTVISQTWTHLLYNTAMHHFFLSKPNVTMILNHSLASSASHYESISKVDKHITANGLSVKLLSDVTRGSQTCQNLDFSSNPSMQYNSTVIPKLIGWKFMNSEFENGFICNFSADTFKLELASVFNNTMQFSSYFADTNFVVNGLSSLNLYSGNSQDQIIIYPFSITQIRSEVLTGVQNKQSNSNNAFWIFPNPTQNDITLRVEDAFDDATIVIYNVAGQVMKRIHNLNGNQVLISTVGFQNGTYLLEIHSENTVSKAKFIVD